MKKNEISTIRRAVCNLAHAFMAQGFSKSEAFKKAWVTVKSGEILVIRATGVASGPDAKARQHSIYCVANAAVINVKPIFRLVPEPENPYDPYAVKVIVTFDGGENWLHIGYVPTNGKWNKFFAKYLSLKNKVLKASFIPVGGKERYEHYGLEMRFKFV